MPFMQRRKNRLHTPSSVKERQGYILRVVCLAMTGMLAFPAMAWAWSPLVCNSGIPGVGTSLYDTTGVCSSTAPIPIFSILACSFQQILNSVLSKVYCGVQYKLANIITASILLYVIIFGMMMVMGIVPITMKEASVRLMKIVFVWIFATNAAWGIGFGFKFLLGFIDGGMNWVLSIAAAPWGCSSSYVMETLDCMIASQLTAPFSDAGYRLMAFFSALSVAIFPIFMFFLYFLVKSIIVLVRSVITYLLGISVIAFLISMAPIFVSCALFKVTYTFFDSWLRYLISFAFQVVLVFASVALLLVIISNFGTNFVASLVNVIIPYNNTWWVSPVRMELNAVAVCPTGIGLGPYGPVLSCTSTNPADLVPPSAWVFQTGLMYFLLLNITSQVVIVFMFDTLNKNIPDIARQLAGPAYAPMLGGGGGSPYGGIHYPGESALSGAGMGAAQRVSGGAAAGIRSLLPGAVSPVRGRATAGEMTDESGATMSDELKKKIMELPTYRS